MAEEFKAFLKDVNDFNAPLFLSWFCISIPWMSYYSVESLPGVKGLA